jgi:NFACT N-terminal and middle domains/NFACT protein RNA binding domain
MQSVTMIVRKQRLIDASRCAVTLLAVEARLVATIPGAVSAWLLHESSRPSRIHSTFRLRPDLSGERLVGWRCRLRCELNSHSSCRCGYCTLQQSSLLASRDPSNDIGVDSRTRPFSLENHDALDYSSHAVIDDCDVHLDSQGDFGPMYRQWCLATLKCEQTLIRKKNALTKELQKAQSIEESVRRAQLLSANLYQFTPGVTKVMVQDWMTPDDESSGAEYTYQTVELSLNPEYESATAEVDALFAQARRAKRGSLVVNELIQSTSTALSTIQDIRLDLGLQTGSEQEIEPQLSIDPDHFRLIQDTLLRTAGSTGFVAPSDDSHLSRHSKSGSKSKQMSKAPVGAPASNVRKLLSPGGCTVLVGRNQRGNEYISFSVARDDDIWMHSRGVPGAHVLIQQRRGSPTPTDACYQFAANLAVFYSDARAERKADVSTAQPKHLLKPRGAPLGALKLRQEESVLVGYPSDVPEALKEDRALSGQTDEYRNTDKALQRRWTSENAKVQQQKRKQKAQTKSKRRQRHGE